MGRGFQWRYAWVSLLVHGVASAAILGAMSSPAPSFMPVALLQPPRAPALPAPDLAPDLAPGPTPPAAAAGLLPPAASGLRRSAPAPAPPVKAMLLWPDAEREAEAGPAEALSELEAVIAATELTLLPVETALRAPGAAELSDDALSALAEAERALDLVATTLFISRLGESSNGNEGAAAAAGELDRTHLIRGIRERVQDLVRLLYDGKLHAAGGTARLRLSLSKNGYVDRAEVVRSTGHPDLDDQAEHALHLAEPFTYVAGWVEIDVVFGE